MTRLLMLVEGQSEEIFVKQTSDGPTLMGKIGIPMIRTACPHFAGWLDRLEALGATPPPSP